MNFPVSKFRFWLPSLYLSLPLALAGVAEPITLQFNEPSFENAIFEEDLHRSRIVTNAPELELDAMCSDEDVAFILVQINGVNYPVFPKNGQFGQTIQLSEGKNNLQATYKEDGLQTTKREIIRLLPGSIQSVHTVSKGKQPVLLTEFTQDAPSPTTTSIPTILITGSKGAPEGLKIQVKDQYGNLVMVDDEQEEQFKVRYTLRDGSNSLTFRYLFEDQIFKTETMQVQLEDVLSLDVDSSASTEGFVSFSDTTQHFTTQVLELPISGHVEAIENGEVQLVIEEQALTLPVVDHKFATTVAVSPSKTTTVKVSFTIEDQSYFNYLEINHVAPKFTMDQLFQGQLDGNSIHDGKPVAAIETNSFRSSSPVVQLSGDIQFLGDLDVLLRNSTTGNNIDLFGKKGDFKASIPLAPGANQLELVVSNGVQDVQCYQFDVLFESPITITEFNNKPLEQNPMEVTGSTLQLAGEVDSIKRGILKLNIVDNEYRIPVVNGRFKYSQRHQLSGGQHLAQLSFDHAKFQFDTMLELNVLEQAAYNPVQEVESQVVAQVASADGINEQKTLTESRVTNTQSALQKQNPLPTALPQESSTDEANLPSRRGITTTPPKPKRTSPPKNVRDPNNRRANLTGKVTIGFLILENGKIDNTSFEIFDSSHELLVKEAERTLSKWRFEPAKANGVPVSKRSKITLTWN